MYFTLIQLPLLFYWIMLTALGFTLIKNSQTDGDVCFVYLFPVTCLALRIAAAGVRAAGWPGGDTCRADCFRWNAARDPLAPLLIPGARGYSCPRRQYCGLSTHHSDVPPAQVTKEIRYLLTVLLKRLISVSHINYQ